MSQQHMEFDEANRQGQNPHMDNYETGYRDPYAGTYTGQKAYTQIPIGSDKQRMGMRLALAIVSLALLVPLAGIIFGVSSGFGLLGPIYALIGMGIVCLTIMVVNVVFSRQ